jgi:ribosomal protein S12 methylthiotransferase
LQQKIAFQKNEQLLHKKLEVVIEEQLSKNMYRARSYAEAPEIDPLIYVQASKKLRIGKYYTVEIIKTKDYDLVGKI